MELKIVLLVLASATLHPIWNLLIKKHADPQLGFLHLTMVLALTGLVHGLLTGVDFFAALDVLPLLAFSVLGQILYGTCLTLTLKRGDLSVYYPIVRASPIFVVIFSFLVLGTVYPLAVLVGIGMAVAGGFLILYRPGTNLLDNPGTLGLAIIALSGTGIYSLADAQLMKTISPPVLVVAVEGTLLPYYTMIWLIRRRSTEVTATASKRSSHFRILIPGAICYASYYLILLAYQLGGDVAAVTSIRQASIPISVALGGFFLREGLIRQRLAAACLLALGIIVITIFG